MAVAAANSRCHHLHHLAHWHLMKVKPELYYEGRGSSHAHHVFIFVNAVSFFSVHVGSAYT